MLASRMGKLAGLWSALALLCLIVGGQTVAAGRHPNGWPWGLTLAPEPATGSVESAAPKEQQSQPDEALKRESLLKELAHLDGEVPAQQLSLNELQRRVRLSKVLDAISEAMAGSPITSGGGSEAEEQLARSGRNYPAREPAAGAKRARPHLRPVARDEQQQQRIVRLGQWRPNVLDERQLKGPLKLNQRGFIWAQARPPGSLAATYGDQQLNERQTVPANSPQHERRALLQQQQQQHQREVGAARDSDADRPGSASSFPGQPKAAIEWKRAEQSRWNNLRGMWGKRAAVRDDDNLAEKFKDLLEEEAAAERVAASAAGNDA